MILYPNFDGEPLQEEAANAAITNKSLLAVFPNRWWQVNRFSVRALIAGTPARGLTVVISPLFAIIDERPGR